MYTAGVLIDDYPLPQKEVNVLGHVCSSFVSLSLGNLDLFKDYMVLALAKELALEPEKVKEIKSHLTAIHESLWEDRNPWTIYDKSRASLSSLIAYNLERRLLRDEEEIKRSFQEIKTRESFLRGDHYTKRR